MSYFTTQQAAKKLGIGLSTLIRYIVEKNVPAPAATKIGKREVRAWTEEDIQRFRELLPKIANGRKTRWQKQRNQKPQLRAVHGAPESSTVPHETGPHKTVPKKKREKKKQ